MASVGNNGVRTTVEISGVSKSFGKLEVLKNLNLTVPQNSLVSILGPSGSGKSTILGMIVGSLIPDTGRILFGDRDVTHTPIHMRGVGMVFQRYTLFPNQTIAKNVSFPLEVRKVPETEINKRVRKILEVVGLLPLADRYPAQISGGQAQRVALARALVFEPSILLMDEPLGALDRNLRKSLQFEIRRIQQEFSIPTVYVTHDQEEALSISDKIMVLKGGDTMAVGTPKEMYETPGDAWTAKFLGDANILPIKGWTGTSDGAASCVTSLGAALVARRHPALRDGDTAVLLVRPERCRVSRAAGNPAYGLMATVIREEYLGQHYKLTLNLADGFENHVHQPIDGDDVDVGSEVFCSWEPGAVILIKA